MPNGTVKWFDARKGCGLIQPDGGGPDVIVYIEAVEQAGLRNLHAGEKLSYEVKIDRGKETAVDLQPA